MTGILGGFSRFEGKDRIGPALLALALVAAATFAARGITDESAVSLHGDMPRHMMNGVFLWDLLRSGALWSVEGAVTYAQEYYVRYPALSLGHHPPLTAVILVPFYAVFGVSVFAARLAMVACVLTAVIALFSLTRRLYGPVVAGWASLLFSVQPAIAQYGQQVMAEAPVMAVVLVAIDALLRFCSSGRGVHYAVFVVIAAASLYAKQTAALLFPIYALTLFARVRPVRLLRWDVAGWTVGGAALCLPILGATLALSPHSVAWVAETVASTSRPVGAVATVSTVLPSLTSAHLSGALLVVMLAGLAVSIAQRDRRILLSLLWAAVVTTGTLLFVGPYETARYAILAIPAYVLCAASVAATTGRLAFHWAAALLLVTAVALGLRPAARVHPVGAGGYEATARYVTGRTDSPTVLYSGSVDTGYFVFFVRKHDRERQQIVMRSDKVLTTSMLGTLSVETHINEPGDIYPLLQAYGTRLVVIEDRLTGERALDWLRDELKGPRFLERHRVAIATRDRRLAGTDLVTYEYRDATVPSSEASLDINLPIIGRDISVRLSDLLERNR